MSYLRRLVRAICMRTGKAELFFKLFGAPNHFEWAEWLRRHRGLRIGEGTTVNPCARFVDRGMVTIGRNCSISWAEFLTHSGGDRILGPRWGIHAASARPIVIGDNCIVGAGARIMAGVTIGDDCVIGAGAHIAHDVPAGSLMKPLEAVYAGPTTAYAQRLNRRSVRGAA